MHATLARRMKPSQFNRDDEIPQELLDLEGKKIVWVIRVKGTVKKPPNPG
ncbi:unnamed protein product [Brassica oleracea]